MSNAPTDMSASEKEWWERRTHHFEAIEIAEKRAQWKIDHWHWRYRLTLLRHNVRSKYELRHDEWKDFK